MLLSDSGREGGREGGRERTYLYDACHAAHLLGEEGVPYQNHILPPLLLLLLLLSLLLVLTVLVVCLVLV
jgi:hypothetical protein